jgi:hypothetical protein
MGRRNCGCEVACLLGQPDAAPWCRGRWGLGPTTTRSRRQFRFAQRQRNQLCQNSGNMEGEKQVFYWLLLFFRRFGRGKNFSSTYTNGGQHWCNHQELNLDRELFSPLYLDFTLKQSKHKRSHKGKRIQLDSYTCDICILQKQESFEALFPRMLIC